MCVRGFLSARQWLLQCFDTQLFWTKVTLKIALTKQGFTSGHEQNSQKQYPAGLFHFSPHFEQQIEAVQCWQHSCEQANTRNAGLFSLGIITTNCECVFSPQVSFYCCRQFFPSVTETNNLRLFLDFLSTQPAAIVSNCATAEIQGVRDTWDTQLTAQQRADQIRWFKDKYEVRFLFDRSTAL